VRTSHWITTEKNAFGRDCETAARILMVFTGKMKVT